MRNIHTFSDFKLNILVAINRHVDEYVAMNGGPFSGYNCTTYNYTTCADDNYKLMQHLCEIGKLSLVVNDGFWTASLEAAGDTIESCTAETHLVAIARLWLKVYGWTFPEL